MRIFYRDGWSETFLQYSRVYVTPDGLAIIGDLFVGRLFSDIAEIVAL